MSAQELAALEARQRDENTVAERLFRERNARNAYALRISVAEDWLKQFRSQADDMATWVAALEDLKRELLERVTSLDDAMKETPENLDDPMQNYGHRARRSASRAERTRLSTLLDAIERGGFGDTDLPELLARRGIVPLPGQSVVYRGPGRVPLPRAKKALEALRGEIARRETELAAARAALAALDADN